MSPKRRTGLPSCRRRRRRPPIMSSCRRRCRRTITTKPSISMKSIRKATTRRPRCSTYWRRCSCRRRRRASTSTAAALSSPIASRWCVAIRCARLRLVTVRRPVIARRRVPAPAAPALRPALSAIPVAPPRPPPRPAPAGASIKARSSAGGPSRRPIPNPASPSARPARPRRDGPPRGGQRPEHRRQDVRLLERRRRRA